MKTKDPSVRVYLMYLRSEVESETKVSLGSIL